MVITESIICALQAHRMRNASALTGNTKDISTHILGGDKRHYDSFSCDQHYFCSFLYSFYDIWVQHFFPPKFLKVCLILASYVIISNMSILYNMFHIFSFHIMFSFMKSNQAWLLCDHVVFAYILSPALFLQPFNSNTLPQCF